MIKRGKIELLNNIIIDKSLLKYKIEEKIISGNTFTVSENIFIGENSNPTISMSRDEGLEYLEYCYSNAPTFYLKFKIWLYKKLYSRNLNVEKQKKVTKEDLQLFFDSVKINVNELEKEKIENILKKYSTILNNAKDNNQTALIERINDYATMLKYEILLSNSKFNKYLTEEDIVKYYNIASVYEKYKTGLCLTYVKNFIKIIPEEITTLKKEADLLKVFDNYVILHYDYSGKAVSDTKEETAKKKDPILFGIIQNSTKLYYIGDWIDDYCDLTLDIIIEKLGKDVSILNEETIIDNINKI